MPMYDYECAQGHIHELFVKREEFQYGVVCPECNQSAIYLPSFYYTSRAAQRFTPVVVHKDSEGNIRYPGRADAPVPKGFQKVELTDLSQVRRFEAEVNKKDREQAEKFRDVRNKYLDGQLKENRRVMAGLVEKFTPRGRKIYDQMKQVSEEKQRRGAKDVNPGFYVEAFTQDSSNRQGYRDKANDWGRHHGSGK